MFRPPTQAVNPMQTNATPVILATTTPDGIDFLPTATPTCSDWLTFVEDLTIPDGTSVIPGSVLDKRWQVENSGTCNWDRITASKECRPGAWPPTKPGPLPSPKRRRGHAADCVHCSP